MSFALKGQVSTQGTDFWFGYMTSTADAEYKVFITAQNRAEITVRVPGLGFRQDLIVNPGVSTEILLPSELRIEGEGRFGTAVNIKSDEQVTVYALNGTNEFAESTVILPTRALGLEYMVVAYKAETFTEEWGLSSEFLIVPTEDNTRIEIIPSQDTEDGLAKGQAFEVVFNAGEVYQVRSLSGTLSGSEVRVIDDGSTACGKIAIFGGNEMTQVGACEFASGDENHLYEQIFPLDNWGREFLYIPFISGSDQEPDQLMVVTSERDTKVELSGTFFDIPNKGATLIIDAWQDLTIVTSDKPIALVQLGLSKSCNLTSTKEASMTVLSPINQGIKEVTFNAFNISTVSSYYLSLLFNDSVVNEVLLDGVNIADQFVPIEGKSYAIIEISKGDHTIEARKGVGAYVYGLGPTYGIGFSAGVNLVNQALSIEIPNQIEIEGALSICTDQTINLNAIETGDAENNYESFLWDFGDGNFGEGHTVNHTYSEPGIYEITLTAISIDGSCSSNDVAFSEVNVLDFKYDDFSGPLSVCPDAINLNYEVTGLAEGSSISWFIEGGIIVSESGSSAIVDWGEPNNNAKIGFKIENQLGCSDDSVVYNVLVNERLQPEAPESSSATEICYENRMQVTYSTPQRNGSQFEWFVEGGTINSGNFTNEITVDWNSGDGKVWYKESSLTNAFCEGNSDTLSVSILDPITFTAIVEPVSCFNGSDGKVELSIQGGKEGSYRVIWSDGQQGPMVDGLKSGDYEVRVIDDLGCQFIGLVTINEPDYMSVASLNTYPVFCFGESTGRAEVNVNGGTTFPNNKYIFEVTSTDGFYQRYDSNELTGLPAGTYNLLITDANECTLSTQFEIGDVLQLEIDFDQVINDPICPGESNGSIYVDAKGGTPDYQFIWDLNNLNQGKEITELSKGTYLVTVIDQNNCRVTQHFDITERLPKVFLPNSFSPNDDGVNDEFMPVADCLAGYSMQVYNKWGNVIFSTEETSKGWDGTFNGVDAPIGKYSYMLVYKTEVNNILIEQSLRGTFRLLR